MTSKHFDGNVWILFKKYLFETMQFFLLFTTNRVWEDIFKGGEGFKLIYKAFLAADLYVYMHNSMTHIIKAIKKAVII